MIFSKKFIQKNAKYNTFDEHISAPYLRREFIIDNLPKQAEITICGLGFYELYINGKRITKGYFAPYTSNPDDILYYDNYDIKQHLKTGKNAIGLILGNGFLNNPGGDIWDFDKAAFRDAPKVALAFEFDGKLLFEADQKFKTSNSPITFDDYRAGEHYDARKEQDNWNNIDFDDSSWDNAIIAKCPKGEQKIAECEPIRVIDEYKPKSFKKVNGGWLYSFPCNNAGVCRLKINGESGQKIILTYGEVVIDDCLDMANISFGDRTRKGYMQTDIYICKGDEQEIYAPYFTYHGFQYVFVEGITDEQATSELLTYLVIHSDIKSAGKFECSDNIINKLQENTRRSTLSNFHYFLTDCPQREKNGWTGDAALSAEQLMLNFHAEKSMREWLNNVRAAQKPNGALPGIVPTSGWGFHWGNGPAWDTALVQLPYYVYKYNGNKSILEENFSAIIKYLEYTKTKLNENGLLGFGLGDWCQPSRDDGAYQTNIQISDTLTIIDTCYKASKIAKILGSNEKEQIDKYYELLRENFRNKFVEKGKIRDEYATQTAVAMALYYKVFEKSEQETALSQLLELIAEKNNHFNTGILGGRVLFRVLSDYGQTELAHKLITQPTFPSYAYHLGYNSTTLWEDFHELEENRHALKSGKKLNSINHHFWGDISAWFYKYIAGIRINSGLESTDTVEIKPHFISGIDYCKAEREYMGGKIIVEWKRENNQIIVNVSAPENVKIIKN